MRPKQVVILILSLIVLSSMSCYRYYPTYVRNLLAEDVEVNVKFFSPEDRVQWERMDKNMSAKHNLKDHGDFNTNDTMFTENIVIKQLDTVTIAYTIPAKSMVETGDNNYWDEIVFRGNSYDKKLYYDGNKLKLYNNNTKKKEKAIFKTRRDTWTRFFFDIQ